MNKPLLAIMGLIAAGGTAAGVIYVASSGGEEEIVQQSTPTAPTTTAPATSTPSLAAPITVAVTPSPAPVQTSAGVAKASLPGGYEFSYPSSWTQVVFSEDPYIAKFFLTPPAEPGSEALADLEVTVYQNPQRLPLEKFFNGQERPNLFKDAVAGYTPFSAGGATGYWFDNVLGFTNYTVVALSSGGYVYEFADPQEHQADGVYLQIVQSFKPAEA